MKKEELKKQLMNLWKETFQDSDDYISLVFDSYFDKSFVEFEECDGEIVSSLIAIPYNFIDVNNDHLKVLKDCDFLMSEKKKLKGLYLCGLSTKKSFRGKGIMKKLIKNIISKLEKLNYDFCFLIPSDDRLRKYYESLGFINAFNRSELLIDGYEIEKNIKKIIADDCDSVEFFLSKFNISELLVFDEKLKRNKDICSADYSDINIEELFEFFNECELKGCGLQIIHSLRDFKNVCFENYISGGKIIISRDSENKINGISFIEFQKDKTDSCVVIKNIYYDSLSTGIALLFYLIKNYEINQICLYENSINPSLSSLIKNICPECKFFANKPYGMLQFSKPLENLKFCTNRIVSCKFENLVKNNGQSVSDDFYLKTDLNETLNISMCENEIYRKESGVLKSIKDSEISKFKTYPIGTISLMLD